MSDTEPRAVQAIEFLSKAATYFENRPTHGEDKAHWANVFNAKNCRDIANLIARLAGNGLELTAAEASALRSVAARLEP